MNIEEQLTDELQRQADRVPAASGDFQRVRRVGSRRLLASRVASIAGIAATMFVVIAAAVMLQGRASETNVAADGVEGTYALSPHETSTRLVDCLQERGLEVTQAENGITYDNRVVSDDEFELGIDECQDDLRRSGFLLPGDNPEHLEVLFAQYQELAECYREAGIDISQAPDLDTFIEARQEGASVWSPQTEAIRQIGREEVTQAEEGCAMPTPEQVTSNG